METVDDETSAAAIDFIKRQVAAGKPFFVWWNGTAPPVRAEHRVNILMETVNIWYDRT
jgi:arylsulfatase